MGAQGHPQHRRLGQVLERPHHPGVCDRNLARRAVPCDVAAATRVDRDKLMEQRRYSAAAATPRRKPGTGSGAGEASRAGRRQRRGKKSEDGAVARRRISASPRRHEGRLLHSVARTKGEKPRLRGRQWIWQAAAAAALKIEKRAGNETRERGWSDGQQLK